MVDGYKEEAKRFIKGQEIIRKAGASSLRELAPEKFAQVINEFRKAVILFKGQK